MTQAGVDGENVSGAIVLLGRRYLYLVESLRLLEVFSVDVDAHP